MPKDHLSIVARDLIRQHGDAGKIIGRERRKYRNSRKECRDRVSICAVSMVHRSLLLRLSFVLAPIGEQGIQRRELLAVAGNGKLLHCFGYLISGLNELGFISKFQLRLFGRRDHLFDLGNADQPVNLFQVFPSCHHALGHFGGVVSLFRRLGNSAQVRFQSQPLPNHVQESLPLRGEPVDYSLAGPVEAVRVHIAAECARKTGEEVFLNRLPSDAGFDGAAFAEAYGASKRAEYESQKTR